MKCPTVKVKDSGDSFVIINECDFDESEHELFDEKPKKKTKVKKDK